MEVVYLLPFASDTPEAMQYTPRLNGDAIWQLLNSSHEKGIAHIPHDEWVHLKILVIGYTYKVFLNQSLVLTVTNLRRGDSEGTIGLWALGGGGYFSKLSYRAFPASRSLPNPSPFKRKGLLTNWGWPTSFDGGDVDVNTYPGSIRIRARLRSGRWCTQRNQDSF